MYEFLDGSALIAMGLGAFLGWLLSTIRNIGWKSIRVAERARVVAEVERVDGEDARESNEDIRVGHEAGRQEKWPHVQRSH